MPPPARPPPVPPPGGPGYGAYPPAYGAPGYGAGAYGPSEGYFGASDGVSLASYGARLGGWLIDFVIVLAVTLIVTIPLHQFHRQHVLVRGTHTYRYHLGGLGIVIDAAIVILYGGLLCGSAAGTDARDDGHRAPGWSGPAPPTPSATAGPSAGPPSSTC